MNLERKESAEYIQRDRTRATERYREKAKDREKSTKGGVKDKSATSTMLVLH